jgi:8-oxo-dGTP diphosphatase/2-hydroxy-dATP diphosphatase
MTSLPGLSQYYYVKLYLQFRQINNFVGNKRKILTLCCLKKDGKILLGMKKRGFGAGRWNGFGGKLKENETIEQAAKRETQEECGIEITELEKMGILDFEFQGSPGILEVNIFTIQKYSGEPTETEEMKPQWFSFPEIPFDSMWPDDQFWISLFLEDKKFKGYFLFDKDGNKILHKKLEIVNNI